MSGWESVDEALEGMYPGSFSPSGGQKGQERSDEPKFAAICSYREVRWSMHCEECGAVIDEDFGSAAGAREAWDNLRALEGRALCDEHWSDPDEVA